MFERIYKSWWFFGLLVVAALGVGFWRWDSRRTARLEAEQSERIRNDVRKSLSETMKPITLCPLSEPNCNQQKQ
jgi:uncharacterized iron-regulated membrane protein